VSPTPAEPLADYVYRTDARGVISYLNPEWVEFARRNWRPDFQAEELLGTRLLAHISDVPTRHLYSMLMERVEASGREVVLGFRCDAPGLRRDIILQVRPASPEGLEWISSVVAVEPRPPVPLLAPARRGRRLLTVCSWCKKVRVPDWLEAPELAPGRWVEVEEVMPRLIEPVLPDLTHGACPPCYARVLRELRGEP
jgi:hypothetical protein